MAKPDQTQATAPDKRKGWLLLGGASAFILAEMAAIPFIRHSHSHFLVGLVRGLGILPVTLGVSGVRALRGARQTKKEASLDRP